MLLDARHDYSPAERQSDAVVHFLGIGAALIAVPVLIILAVTLRGDLPAVASTTIYGVALLTMLVFSALFHLTTQPRLRRIFRSLDHTAILCLIAATYTPFVLLSGAEATGLLVTLWAAALLGAALRAFAPDRLKLAAIALALGMGWAGLIGGGALFALLSTPVMVLITIGGVLYTVGVGFCVWERLLFHYTIWHLCVLAASAAFYAAVTVQLVQSAQI
ncbi:MAG: hemolysin III family protein [Tabrizicola sp.]|uniref:PAQR family membrane homeostasis protein TrhA n=1 Tax=Tabrizicola sp. TaxID=2005166 RepID=UPI002ABB7535|nr:hemolysin III family protein [Tabrizicola sp.]MDZ4088664.1 hemolysin III family protein [Tabrizicola sp.]